ncbi:MAG TPA: outer membrane beta-barrel protein [Flavobacterium sp.]|nr:outer membrane beta-barrel protein [Flavobacterium sp.]
MKKILATAFLALVLSTAAQAQTQKDWYIIGGNLSNMGLDFQDGNTNFSLDIMPRVAWFVRDDFAVGGEVLLGLETGDGFTKTNYGVGPVARYYLSGTALESVGKTRWFLDGNIGFRGTNTKVKGSDGVSTNGLGIGFGPGLAYFLNQNIALEAVAKYNLTVGFGNSTTTNSINLGLGFQIYLPKSKLRSMENDVK